jgi:apolipoprotein D and lipocalin family protein
MKSLFLLLLIGCSSVSYKKTAESVDLQDFMGTWNVQAGRFTIFERGVHNGVEIYTWNEKEQRIDIEFTYNKGALDGEKKSVPQKGWVHNKQTNAHWKISPFWPLKFDYLVIYLSEDKKWTAIGVPSESYLWIMSRDKNPSRQEVDEVLNKVKNLGYNTSEIKYVEHSKN